jgi:methyl coenzyme M reductase subunit C
LDVIFILGLPGMKSFEPFNPALIHLSNFPNSIVRAPSFILAMIGIVLVVIKSIPVQYEVNIDSIPIPVLTGW